MRSSRLVPGVAAAALVAAFAVQPASGSDLHAAAVKCTGTATIDQTAQAFGINNQIDADFTCNKGFKKFKVAANKPIDGAGLANEGFTCKSDGKKAYKCSGSKKIKSGHHEQTSFTTKASDPCAGSSLKVKISAAGKTFALKGPC